MTEIERLARVAKLRNLQAAIDAELANLVAAAALVSVNERARLRRESRANWGSAKCGTDGGYYRHRRSLREDPCDDCRAAHAAAEKARSQRKRESAA